MRSENRAKDDESRMIVKSSISRKIATDKEKVSIEKQDRQREVQLHSDLTLENMKKEVKQRIELEYQQKINSLQLTGYKNARDQQT